MEESVLGNAYFASLVFQLKFEQELVVVFFFVFCLID